MAHNVLDKIARNDIRFQLYNIGTGEKKKGINGEGL